MTWDELIVLAKKEYGLNRLVWTYNKHDQWKGRCFFPNGTICLNHFLLLGNENEKIRVLFHELGHIYCYKNGLWKNYHTTKQLDDLTQKEKTLLIKTALKAEKWVDKWAYKQIKKYYPDILIDTSDDYSNPLNVKIFKEELLTYLNR